MTAQIPHTPVPDSEVRPTPDQADPVGPITLPRRGRAGARALALIGCPVGVAAANALVLLTVGGGEGTFTTISAHPS